MTPIPPTPTIAVIIPAYNAATYLAATLESVQRQSFSQLECIVVDDGSTDATAQIAGSLALQDSRFRLVSQPNAGVSAARNHGLQFLTPTISHVLFLDADDLLLPDALESLFHLARESSACVGAHGLADFIDQNGAPISPGAFAGYCRKRLGFDGTRIVEWNTTDPTDFNILTCGIKMYPTAVALLSRDALQKVGLFNTRLKIGEDWDMWVRLARLAPFAFLDRTLVLYRRHPSNTTASEKNNRYWANYLRYLIYASPDNTALQRIFLRRAYRAIQRHKIREKLAEIRTTCPRRPFRSALLLAHIAGISLRCLRGHPTPAG